MFWGRGRCPRQCPGSRLADTPGSCPPFLLIPPKALPLGMPNSHSLPLGTQNTALGGSQPAFQPRSSCVPCLCAIIWSKATPSDCPSLPPPQDSSLPKIIPAGTTLTPEADLESVKTLSSEAQRLQHGILPPLSTERWARGRVPAALPAATAGCPPGVGGAAGGRWGRSHGEEMTQVWGEGSPVLSPFLRTALPWHGGGPSVGPAGSSDAHPLPPTPAKPTTRSRPVPARGRRKAPLCPPHPPSRSATW